MTRPLFSIVVCTYNRADLLPMCLGSLANQTLDKSLYHIVVVNNNSSDSTAEVVSKFVENRPNFSTVIETAQGIANARNCGWRMAQTPYVGYIDDDCQAPTHWLELAREIIASYAPIVFGGSSFAFYLTPKPYWYKDSYINHDFGRVARLLHNNEYFDSMNMFIRRSAFDVVGGFDPELGMKGKQIAYGEETAFLQRVREMMPKELIYYHPELYVYHAVRVDKTSLWRGVVASFANGQYSRRLFGVHLRSSTPDLLLQATRTLYYLILDLAHAFFARDRVRYPFIQNYFYERVFKRIQSLGDLYQQYTQLRKY